MSKSKLFLTSILVGLGMAAGLAAAQGSARDPEDGGRTQWIQAPTGPLKVRVYTSKQVSPHPVLLVIIHGDFADPPPTTQYDYARGVTGGNRDLVAVGVLRPGYVDNVGDRSGGSIDGLTGNNYTPAVVDGVAAVIRQLRTEVKPRAVVVFGHSGGAAIAANLIGRHPRLADAAALSACNCDVVAWRARMKARKFRGNWDAPNPSLLPLDLVARIPIETKVRMVVGAADENTLPIYSQTYAAALARHGIDAKLVVAPGLTHASMFEEPVRAVVRELIALY